jgi:hypothetical protein
MAAGFAKGPAVARRLGDAAVAAAMDNVAARVAAMAPEIAVTTRDDAVVLTAPGLVPRVFGSRRRGPDPRLAGMLGGTP